MKFELEIERHVVRYETVVVEAVNVEGAREAFFDGGYQVVAQYEKMQDTDIVLVRAS